MRNCNWKSCFVCSTLVYNECILKEKYFEGEKYLFTVYTVQYEVHGLCRYQNARILEIIIKMVYAGIHGIFHQSATYLNSIKHHFLIFAGNFISAEMSPSKISFWRIGCYFEQLIMSCSNQKYDRNSSVFEFVVYYLLCKGCKNHIRSGNHFNSLVTINLIKSNRIFCEFQSLLVRNIPN